MSELSHTTPLNLSGGLRARRPSMLAQAASWFSPSAIVSLFAGLFTAFTVSVVGEMPVGELLLVATAGWALFCMALNHKVPGSLFSNRWFKVMLLAQVIALIAYIGSDLYRGSAPRDMARGWARMVFLAIDLIAVTYLFSCSRKNLLIFIIGQAIGEVARTYTIGPLFGDFWKFGVGGPITYGIILLGSFGGPFLAMIAAGAMGVAHFLMDYRSVGASCLLLAALIGVQIIPKNFRKWALPIGLVIAMGGAMAVYQFTTEEAGGKRTTRSDVDRSSMMKAATEAFVGSPIIGQGSWFSNSDVYDNFLQIRYDAAKLAGIGGFLGPNAELETTAIHSQLLVALAEGGLFGAAFFIVFAVGLFRTGWELVLNRGWDNQTGVWLLLLLFAVMNLFFSPFSGAHRVYIAMAAGLVLLTMAERKERLELEESEA